MRPYLMFIETRFIHPISYTHINSRLNVRIRAWTRVRSTSLGIWCLVHYFITCRFYALFESNG